jgi:CTP synthase
MRLGVYRCNLKTNSLAYKIYNEDVIFERHRHRYEFNNTFFEEMESYGMIATGINPDANLVEIIELENHPFFIGVQFHPELKSRVEAPHPMFVSFIAKAIEMKTANEKQLVSN